QAALQSLQANGSNLTWMRSGASPDLALPPEVFVSLDGVFYGYAGTMKQIPAGWRFSGLNQPMQQIFYVRVRGRTVGGLSNGSQSTFEVTQQFFGDDRIFSDAFD
ncbi:MAG TPA: hypothetical protein VHQ21_01750, partial [Rhodanobacteraceae bacterium]|nr:hypothetical protein [Rhodanobacteraceae bacterium]